MSNFVVNESELKRTLEFDSLALEEDIQALLGYEGVNLCWRGRATLRRLQRSIPAMYQFCKDSLSAGK